MATLEDGSRWLVTSTDVTQVAPPGTDHHIVRWVAHGLPAVDAAVRLAAEADDDSADRHGAIDELLTLTDFDDIALASACAFTAMHALKQLDEPGNDRAVKRHKAAAVLLDQARVAAQHRRVNDQGLAALGAAAEEWRSSSDGL